MIDVEKVQKRVQGLSDGELLSWLEAALPGMQRHLEAYARSRNLDHLGELAIAETTANLAISELLRRKFAAVSPPPAADSVPQDTTVTAPKTSGMRRALQGLFGIAPAPEPGIE